jgi:hypothetical protein
MVIKLSSHLMKLHYGTTEIPRVPNSSPSAKNRALGEEMHSGKRGFPECRQTHGTWGRVTLGESLLPRVQHSGKRGTHKRKFTFDGAFRRNRLQKNEKCLPRVPCSSTRGRWPLPRVPRAGTRGRSLFPECLFLALGEGSLP